MDDTDSPVEALLKAVQSALLARRALLIERVRGVEQATEAYRRAIEAQIALEFAEEHGFKHPGSPALSLERAAELLHAAVSALLELSGVAPLNRGKELPGSANPEAVVLSSPSTLPPKPQPFAAKIVVIGMLAGRDKTQAVPAALADSVEWVDTERQGVHAIGNLPQRLRQRRVAGIIILDRAVKHRHTEPVMAAAREARIPIAFAGQGGRASLARAFAELERARTKDSG